MDRSQSCGRHIIRTLSGILSLSADFDSQTTPSKMLALNYKKPPVVGAAITMSDNVWQCNEFTGLLVPIAMASQFALAIASIANIHF